MSWTMIVPGVALLGLVIFVHELGHFLAAKWRGVRVLRFSLGFGPKLAGFTRGETEYRLAWIPLGGYVQMAGDSPGEDQSMPSGPDEFLSHPWPGRLAIALAGPFANLVAAFCTLFAIGLIGFTDRDYPNELGAVPDTSLAAHAGLREGDKIQAVNGRVVHTWIQMFTAKDSVAVNLPLRLSVQRGGQPVEVVVPPDVRAQVFSSLVPPPGPPVIGNVATGMPAYKAGLKEGDLILAVNGRKIATWDQLPASLQNQADRPVVLRIRRGTQEFDVTVTPMNPDGGAANAKIGIEAPRRGEYIERLGPGESLKFAFLGTGSLIETVYGGMWLTLTRPLYYREYMGGPIFIVQAAGEQAKRGRDFFLNFLAMINVAIMAFNLLPIPVLDGGHIFLALLEAVRRRTLSARAYVRFQKVGLVVIGTLFVLILANDPLRLVQRQRALDRVPQETTHAPAPAGGR